MFTVGKHWLPFALVFMLTIPVLSWFFEWKGTNSVLSMSIFTFCVVFAVIMTHWFFLEVIEYLLGFIMVTDRRIIEVHKSVFLREEMNEIPFEHITNIHHEKNGLIQNALSYGSLRIDSSVGKPIRMHFVPCSENKFAKISGIYGSYISKRESPLSTEEVIEIPKIHRKTEGIRSVFRALLHKTITPKKEVKRS